MRKSAFVLAVFFVSFLCTPNILAAEKPTVILEYKHDVTGDGQQENMIVYGVPFDSNKNYFRKIWVVIGLHNGEKVSIQYEGGYEPKLDFADLNHDGVDDILYSSATGGSGGLYNYALHTVKAGQVEEIGMPDPLQISGHFEEDFEAVLQIPGIEHPILLDLWDRKNEYVSMGLYQENGQLNEPTELMIDPIAMFEVIPLKGGYGLKSFRQISGAYHADGLGRVETQWYYNEGKWNPVKVEWVPAPSRDMSKTKGN